MVLLIASDESHRAYLKILKLLQRYVFHVTGMEFIDTNSIFLCCNQEFNKIHLCTVRQVLLYSNNSYYISLPLGNCLLLKHPIKTNPVE